ncbi:hypothetical protein [Paenibacillus sp. FSL L8-0708]|uniref:hypothetical protein n=1 Tax=Paenibacillus sp. FSL L8-0708 TaxID=2975311 RepID=UPI0030FB0656
MSYQKAKDSIQKAHELKHDNTRFYREFQDKVRTEINAIAGDSDLSADGRYNRTTAAKKKHGTDLMKQAHVRRLQYLAHLKDAKTHAEAEIYAKIKKPDATTLERFEASLRKVKTELLLSMNAKTAAAKLTEFITQVSDPYCASILHEQFADLAGPIIAQTPPSENAKTRHELAQTFEGLASKFESADVRSARDTLESINEMETSKFFIDLVSDAARDTLGREYGDYVNDTDSYFASHEDERPAAPKPATQSNYTNSTKLTPEEEAIWTEVFRKQAEAKAAKEKAEADAAAAAE